MSLKGKKILVTAGPTWVAIDKVRVISNTASGKTGVLLAEALADKGARVSLLIGPSRHEPRSKKIRILRFQFFEELFHTIKEELRKGSYDAVIHTAAVSDYRPGRQGRGKIPSGRASWNLKLYPTPKIIDCVKQRDKNIFLVGFKFKPGASKTTLVRLARGLMRRSRADRIVANTSCAGRYHAWLIRPKGVSAKICSRESLVKQLIKEVS